MFQINFLTHSHARGKTQQEDCFCRLSFSKWSVKKLHMNQSINKAQTIGIDGKGDIKVLCYKMQTFLIQQQQQQQQKS